MLKCRRNVSSWLLSCLRSISSRSPVLSGLQRFAVLLVVGLIAFSQRVSAQPVVSVAAGGYNTMFVKADGTLWATGDNYSGQYGDGTTTNQYTPVQVATGVATVAVADRSHTMFVKTDGTLWATGNNNYGQLGDGTTAARLTPVQVATGVTSVAAGGAAFLNGAFQLEIGAGYATMFIKTDGTLWATGANYFGQLGDGTTTERHTPVPVATGVAAVAAGGSHAVFVKTDGTLWAMGNNVSGQLGDGTTTERHFPVQVAAGVTSVAAGYSHTMFVKSDGTLWATGLNQFGELGDGTTTSRSTPARVANGVASVATSYSHTLFVKTDGTLWAAGYNQFGELGDGTTTTQSIPVWVANGVASVAVGVRHTAFVKNDGTLWASGQIYGIGLGYAERSGPVPTNPVQIAPAPAMAGFAVAMTNGATAFTEGRNVASTPVAVDPALVVTSPTSTLLIAKVSVSVGSDKSTEDALAFLNNGATMGNIVGSFDPRLDVLTLTSAGATATLAEWQSALRAVTYTNTSDSPNTTSRTISFVVHNGISNSATATRTVSITATNDAPTAITLSATTVNPAGGVNATVGTLSSADLDGVDFTYTLVGGSGSTDNALFNIFGATLRANNAAALTKRTYSVRIQTDDGSGGAFARAFTLTATAINDHTVASVAAGPLSMAFVTTDGTLEAQNFFSGTPALVPVARGVASVAVGDNDQTMFVKTDGTLWAMNYGNFGQNGSTGSPMQVATGVASVAVGGKLRFNGGMFSDPFLAVCRTYAPEGVCG